MDARHGFAIPAGPRFALGIFLLAVFIFVLDYGLVFWAEKRVPSGITGVMLATIPAFMAISKFSSYEPSA